MEFGKDVPWKDSKELYKTIDAIQHGDAPWKSYTIRYQGPLPLGTPPKWMTETYQLCTRDSRQVLHHQLATTQFRDKINLSPYHQFDPAGKRVWSNLMSAGWAWSQADKIAEDISNHGAMFVPVVAGSDKTTVSVATGHQEFHPVYMSPGNITNIARRAHGNGLLPVAFLPIPKSKVFFSASKKHRQTAKFQTFCRQMYHSCLARVFAPLKDGMSTRRLSNVQMGTSTVLYGIGPYIVDYPEQVWLAAIVQGWCPNTWDPGTLWTDFGVALILWCPFTHGFPRADIHELLMPDLLHQVIKGTFKDHLVTWVNAYLYEVHGESGANAIIEDIDRRSSLDVKSSKESQPFLLSQDCGAFQTVVTLHSGQVYMSAVAGHIPSEMVKCISAFLDFCYIARRNALTADDLDSLHDALTRFHHHREHIKAVKEPWRRSSHYNALKQMLVTITRLDKLALAGQVFSQLGMMEGTTSSYTARMLRGEQPQPIVSAAGEEDDDDNGPSPGPKSLSSVELARTAERGYPRGLQALTDHINQPRFPEVLHRFLYDQIYPDAEISSANVDLDQCPYFGGNISVFHSAVARFYAPSDLCGAGGMYRERIRANPNWRGEYARYDTMFVETDPDLDGMRVPLDEPDEDTGLWVVQPEFLRNGRRTLAIIHLDCVARAAHLLPIYGSSFIPEDLHFSNSLDAFRAFFVN
ncbi:hypothetical protein BJV74DRAFT_795662 [Russula compacta]|nr:hypothetical protein BJV74DRAFT_795662 [Russula compacta]